MKKLLAGFAVSFLTFVIGNFATFQPAEEVAAVPYNDLGMYTMSTDQLVREADRYNGKVIRVKGAFRRLPFVSIGNLETATRPIRVTCLADVDVCSKLYSSQVWCFPSKGGTSEVTVIGRFTSRAKDPYPPRDADDVMLLEVSDVLFWGSEIAFCYNT